MDTLNVTNETSWNGSDTLDITRTDFGLPSTLVESGLFVIAVIACVLNGLVFHVIQRMHEDKMTVKFLVLNSIAADMLLALGTGSRISLRMLSLTSLDSQTLNLCGKLFYMTFGYFCSFYQVFSAFAVAFDRLLSVCNPLWYHGFRYNRLTKVTIISAVFGVSLGLTLPIFVSRLRHGQSLMAACLSSFAQNSWSEDVLPFLLLSGVAVTFCIYAAIFVIILCYRRLQKNNLGGSGTNVDASLILTFFLIHATYIVLYLPGLLYFSFLGQPLDSQPELNFYLSQSLISIYILNTIVDPVVFIFRITSVRKRFLAMCCRRDKSESSELWSSRITNSNGETLTHM